MLLLLSVTMSRANVRAFVFALVLGLALMWVSNGVIDAVYFSEATMR